MKNEYSIDYLKERLERNFRIKNDLLLQQTELRKKINEINNDLEQVQFAIEDLTAAIEELSGENKK